MSPGTSKLAAFASAIHRLLGSDLVGQRAWRVRHRPPLVRVIEVLEGRVVPATILVTSLLDSGPGSLRAGVEQANLAPDRDTIAFDPSVADRLGAHV
jgi:hypothetical protein